MESKEYCVAYLVDRVAFVIFEKRKVYPPKDVISREGEDVDHTTCEDDKVGIYVEEG